MEPRPPHSPSTAPRVCPGGGLFPGGPGSGTRQRQICLKQHLLWEPRAHLASGYGLPLISQLPPGQGQLPEVGEDAGAGALVLGHALANVQAGVAPAPELCRLLHSPATPSDGLHPLHSHTDTSSSPVQPTHTCICRSTVPRYTHTLYTHS